MNLTIKLTVNNVGEDALRDTLTQNQPPLTKEQEDAGQKLKTDADWTKADIEDYLTDRNIDIVNSYMKDSATRRAAKADTDVTARQLKRKIENADPALKAKVAALLKDVSVTDGTATKTP